MLWILIAILFCVIIYYKIHLPTTYWKKRDVKHVQLIPALVDNVRMIFKSVIFSKYLENIYKQYRNERYVGFYMMQEPMLLINDLDLVRQITIKDFDHFTDHKAFMTVKNEPILSRTLFSLKGDKWRNMRSTLSPIFTSSKMKAMYVFMVETAEQFTNYFLENDSTNLEVKDMFNRYGNDVIANCAFGVKCDSLKDRNNDFYEMGCQLSPTKITGRMFFMMMFTKFSERMGITVYPMPVINFFRNLVAESIKEREKHNIVRPDLIHLMMQAQKGQLKYEESEVAAKQTGFATVEESEYGKSEKKEPLTLETMTAQALLFFLAGFEAASILMSFLCYELIVNPNIQKKLIEEVDQVFKEGQGQVSFEALNNMKYLDMTLTETLRKWIASGIERECLKPYTIEPIRPGEKPVHIEPGLQVWIPNNGFQKDPEYFPDPERFDPERFSDENKNNIKPFTFMSFGIGPRNCIGSRFALLKTKAITVQLLSKFEMVANKNTEIPVTLKASGVNAIPANGIYLDLKRRNICSTLLLNTLNCDTCSTYFAFLFLLILSFSTPSTCDAICEEAKRYIGFYMMQKPMLLINDPDLVRQIAIKDFDHFSDRKAFITQKNDPILSNALSLLKGDKWRRTRSTLCPIFSSSKIRAMHVLIVETAEQYTNYLMENGSTNLEVKDMFHRYGNDVLANVAFGIRCDSMKDRNNYFYRLSCLLSPNKITFRMLFMTMFKKFSEIIGLTVYPPHIIAFFKNLLADSINATEEKTIGRPYLVHLLVQTWKEKLWYKKTKNVFKKAEIVTVEELQNEKSVMSEPLPKDTMTAQVLLFYVAGFDGVSFLMTFICYELILNPEVQERLIREIDNVLITENGRVSYEALNKMKYLNNTILETMRKWVSPGLDRECIKPYTLQPSRPNDKAVHFKPGFGVWIPSNAFHMDPEYFPNPEKFDPERFSNDNKKNIKPFTFMPFGTGPRNCIGYRFAMITVKTIIVHLLSKFEIVANENTEIPIKLKAAGLNAVPANGLYLDFKRRCF